MATLTAEPARADYPALTGMLHGGMEYVAIMAEAALAVYGDNAEGLRARLAEIAATARSYAERAS